MTEITQRPLDKITINLVMECAMSTSGNKCTFRLIVPLTGCPEAFPILDKSENTIVSTFHYLPLLTGTHVP